MIKKKMISKIFKMPTKTKTPKVNKGDKFPYKRKSIGRICIYEMMFNHSINQENVNINHEI